jgi:zinc ribbon protein
MYCPQCATPNNDEARFCRSCGMELEAVGLALKARSAQPIEVRGKEPESESAKEWLEKRSKAVKGVSTGVSLLVVSILIAIAMALFVPANIPWILAWAVLVGWMAMWGGVEVGNGIAGLMEARNRLRVLGLADKQFTNDARSQLLSPAEQPGPSAAIRSSPPLSVTEGTTRQLDDSAKK